MARIKYDTDLPTEVMDRPWVSWGDRSDASPWAGKWVVMVAEDVDARWKLIVDSLRKGMLGPAAKVASAGRVAELQGAAYPFLVYTCDCRDLDDLRRVLMALRDLEFGQEAFYKEDAATRAKVYGEGEALYSAGEGSVEVVRLRDIVHPVPSTDGEQPERRSKL
jgi:hypothetical protein